jgi:hypothetical protein
MRLMLTKKEEFFTLTTYNFCIVAPILMLEMTIFVIHNCTLNETIWHPIQRPKAGCGVASVY